MPDKQFYIQIEGKNVEVTETVYSAYKRPAWAERKRREVRAEHELSLDLMESSIKDPCKPFDEVLADRMMVSSALLMLTERERAIIKALFYERLTECECADIAGIAQQNVSKAKIKAFGKLKKYFSE